MAITRQNIIKWTKMISGRSSLHVDQKLGKHFSADKIEGYFNDMTEKVRIEPCFVDCQELPTVRDENGNPIFFPVAIIQYALGCYDLYLESFEQKYLSEFFLCAEYILSIQEANGAINNFFYIFPNDPYGAMCQGEAASLFVRSFIQTKNIKYADAARKSIDFMMMDINNGGTAAYSGEEVFLYEFTNSAPVLNGWIFSLFGLYDYVLLTQDTQYEKLLKQSINSLSDNMSKFDRRYWSSYDFNNHIASPFYHRLHISQLEALYIISENIVFKEYADRWRTFDKNPLYKTRAFIVKTYQKLVE